ncbi:MAG: hypothetical protein IT356_03050 [Gemmatimonadaceae bacterium]|nr:hypothetical protein [Gemmatimonadaceae bacterium]
MLLIRRSLAALTGSLFLQLTLAGSGTLPAMGHCSMHGGAAQPSAHGLSEAPATAAFHDHAMAAMDYMTGAMAPASAEHAAGGPNGCNHHSAPDACAAMAACHGVATPAPSLTMLRFAATTAPGLAVPADRPVSPSFGPEPPPPRA